MDTPTPYPDLLLQPPPSPRQFQIDNPPTSLLNQTHIHSLRWMDWLRNIKHLWSTALESLGAYRIQYDQLEIDTSSEELGRGGFGVVRRARFHGDAVAVKYLQSSESRDINVAYRLVREMKVWSGLRHPNILPLIGFHLSQELDVALIVCPLVPRGSLRDYVTRERPSDTQTLHLARDALEGLIYLHGLNPPVVHGDIKAANALVREDRRAVLADFGLSKAVAEGPTGLTTSRNPMGSLRWCSPELFEDLPRSPKSDIWAWACLLTEVMMNRVPFSWINNEFGLIKAICGGVLPEPEKEMKARINLWIVMGICWQTDCKKRAAGSRALTALDAVIRINKPTTNVELNRAIDYLWESLELRPPGHPDRASRLHELGMAYWDRYLLASDPTDRETAIKYHEEALSLRPPGHPDRALTLTELGLGLWHRYIHEKDPMDREMAIKYHGEALQLRPKGHPDRAMTLNELGLAVWDRYLHDKDPVNREMAIKYHQEALQLRPKGHPARPISLNELGLAVWDRYVHNQDPADRAKVIECHREALHHRPPGHPERAVSLNELGVALRDRYLHTRDPADRKRAIECLQEAVRLRPPGHPQRSETLENLVAALEI
ncbi:hypothetical protein FRB96_008087 [Tulasnella sp. 330]|nr:hypothetical protein FRB96_008087 [Tulasnella sp. 330]